MELNNNVVYKISCNNCKNIALEESKHSVITKHILDKNHTFNWQNIKILDFESNYFKRPLPLLVTLINLYLIQ